MKSKKSIAIAIIIILIVSLIIINRFLPSKASSNQEANITWHKYEEGIKLAKDQNKKIFIDFYADWCVFCKKMENETFANADIANYLNQNFIPVKVITDNEKSLSLKYKITGLPSFIFLDEKTKRITKLPGFVSASNLMPILQFIKTDSYKSMSFEQFMKNYNKS
ncbi:MAG: thioredoxin fold domain-containing protein [Deltaproteobacteria bacterium]|nr:thioredoxin fold domain-containing protein [Deltaproteobacteria bacterium]